MPMLTAHLSLLDGLLHASGGDGDGGGSGAAARARRRRGTCCRATRSPNPPPRALLQFTLRHTAPLEAAAAAAAERAPPRSRTAATAMAATAAARRRRGHPDDDGVVAVARGASGVAGLQLRANASVRSAAVVTSLTLWRSQLQEVANLGGGGVRQPLSLAALVVPLGRGLQSLARSELAAATAPATVGKVLGLVTLLLSTAARGCATVRALSAPRRAGAARAAAGAAAAGGAAAADVAAAWVEAWLGVAPSPQHTARAARAARRLGPRDGEARAGGALRCERLQQQLRAAVRLPACAGGARSAALQSALAEPWHTGLERAAAPPTRRAARTTTRRRWRRRRRPTTAAAAAARGGGCGAGTRSSTPSSPRRAGTTRSPTSRTSSSRRRGGATGRKTRT